MPIEEQIARHYQGGNDSAADAGKADLGARLLRALQDSGLDIDHLQLADLAPVDEFHVRGRAATAALGQGLDLRPGMRVLDIGSGLGGPARHLAAATGAEITGIDLTPDYCAAASLLTVRVGLADRVTYRQGNALDLPFPAASFDAAYTQHVAMNIADRPRLYREAARVLKTGARFGIYDVFQGSGGEVLYPVPWAATPATSFLIAPQDLPPLLEQAGFRILSLNNVTAEGRDWFARMPRRDPAQPHPALGFHLMLGPIFAEMSGNMLRNLQEDRIALCEVIAERIA